MRTALPLAAVKASPRATWLAFAFVIAALVGSLPAQLRKPCFVTVVDANDQPLQNAEIVMTWSPSAGSPGNPDVVRAMTDARGRGRPDLIVGRLYTAWAIGPLHTDGSRLVSEPTDHGACGAVMELATMHTWRPRNVQIAGTNTIATTGELRLLALPCPNRTDGADLGVASPGWVALPPTPWCSIWVGLCDATETLLQVRQIQPDDPAPIATFQQPRSIHLQIVDAAGKGIAGATAALTLGGHWRDGDALFPRGQSHQFREVGAGDADGHIAVPLHGSGPTSSWLRCHAPHFATVLLPVSEATGTAAEPFRLELPPAGLATGQLRGMRTGETAAAHMLISTSRNAPNAIHSIHLALDVLFDGPAMSLEVPAAVDNNQFVLHLTPGTTAGGTLEGSPRCAVLPQQAGSFEDLPNLDLTTLRTFAVRVLAADGGPAGGAEIAIAQLAANATASAPEITHLTADLAGRAEILLGDGAFAIYAGTATAQAIAFVDEEGTTGDLVLALETIPMLRCRVVDFADQPVRGARVESEGFSGFGGALRGREGWVKEAFAARTAHSLTMRARSDRDGNLFVPVQNWRPWRAKYKVRIGKLTSAPFDIEPRDLGDVLVR